MALAPARHIAAALGGRKVLKADVVSTRSLLRSIESGLPYAAFDAVRERFGLSREDLAEAIGLPLRTLARRRRERKLHPDESDRLVRVARIAAEASRVLGDDRNAGLWLRDEIIALGNRRPIDLLRTDVGAREVEEIIGHIEYGIVS